MLATISLGIVALLLFLWPSAAAPQGPSPRAPRDPAERIDPASELEDRRAGFEGRWRLTQSQDQAQRVVDRAVDRAVAPMSFFIRGIARDRLREGTPIHREITIELRDADRISVRFDDDESYTTRAGRTEIRTSPEGQRLRVRQRFRPSGQLEQVFETDEGARVYVYTPTGHGRLHLETTTESPRMPEPMYFELDYARQ